MEVNIHTNLVTHPVHKEILNYIQLGTTPTLTFNLNNKLYTFEDIYQAKFIFKQGSADPIYYDMIEYSTEEPQTWEFDDHFTYNKTLNTINFTFESDETLQFVPSKKNDRSTYIKFQVIIILKDPNQDKELIINNPETDIYVLDTLYRQIIEL